MLSLAAALFASGAYSPYTAPQSIGYAIFALLLWGMANTWIVRDIGNDVRDGSVERLLLRPVGIGPTYVATGFGKALFNLAVTGPPIAALAWLWPPATLPPARLGGDRMAGIGGASPLAAVRASDRKASST